MTEYIVVLNGKPQGPYPAEKLKELGIRADTFVKTPEMDDYKEAHELADLRLLLNLKTQYTLPQYFATLDIRLLAVIIDLFIFFAIFAFVVFIAMVFIESRETKIIVALSGLVIVPISKLIYGSVMEASSRQSTYGKLLMGIKVTDESGNRISSGQAFLRNLSKLLCIVTLGIGYLMGFFDKRQQCLHDKIAGTLVIKGRLM
jgi:uncharacterized RDD family membrane protein YckC